MKLDAAINRKSYERVVFVLRRHPITFIPIFALFLVLLAVPVAVYLLISNIYPHLLSEGMLYPVAVVLGSIYCLSVYLLFYIHFIDYYLDSWVVTNDRLIDIEQLGLFHRTTTELDLYQIQDVTTKVAGMFATLFHYGNVTVATASSNQQIIFHNVPHPDHIREQLILLANEDRKFHQSQV